MAKSILLSNSVEVFNIIDNLVRSKNGGETRPEITIQIEMDRDRLALCIALVWDDPVLEDKYTAYYYVDLDSTLEVVRMYARSVLKELIAKVEKEYEVRLNL